MRRQFCERPKRSAAQSKAAVSQNHFRFLVTYAKFTRQNLHGTVPCRIRNPPARQVQIFLRMVEVQCLLTNAKFTDDVPITIGIVRLQIIQQAAALAHEHQ